MDSVGLFWVAVGEQVGLRGHAGCPVEEGQAMLRVWTPPHLSISFSHGDHP